MRTVFANKNWTPLFGTLSPRRPHLAWSLLAWVLLAPLNTLTLDAIPMRLGLEFILGGWRAHDDESWTQFKSIGCLIAGTFVVWQLHWMWRRRINCSSMLLLTIALGGMSLAIAAIIFGLAATAGYIGAAESGLSRGASAFGLTLFLFLFGFPAAVILGTAPMMFCVIICRLTMFSLLSDKARPASGTDGLAS